MELDRAAFVQGFAKLISVLFYSSGSWNRCAGATELIAGFFFFLVHVPMHYFASWHSLFQVGVTFISSGHAKCLVKDPRQLLPIKWGSTGLTAGLVQEVQECIWAVWSFNLGCILPSFSHETCLFHDIFGFFFPHLLRADDAQGTLNEKAKQQGQWDQLSWRTLLRARRKKLASTGCFFTFFSAMLSVIPWSLLLAQEKGVPHLPLTAQWVKKARSQNEKRSKKRKINSWVIAEKKKPQPKAYRKGED